MAEPNWRHRCAERRQTSCERLLKLAAHSVRLGPLAGLGTLAKGISVDLATDRPKAVATSAGTVSPKSASDGVAGKGRKLDWRSAYSNEMARGTEVVQKGTTYKLRTKLLTNFLLQFKLLKISNLKLVEAAGVEPASEIVVSRETPCVVYSEISLPQLRTDKKPRKLVR